MTQDLLLRVARSSPRVKFAGMIPDSFFKQEKAKLKKALLVDTKLDSVGYEISELTHGWLSVFKRNLIDFGLDKNGTEIVMFSADILETTLSTIRAKYSTLSAEVSSFYAGPDSAKKEVLGYIGSAISEYIEEKAKKTLGGYLKTIYTLPPGKGEALAAKALKAASPEEMAALEASANGDWSSRVLEPKYRLFQRIKLKEAAIKLLQKEKVEYPFLDFVDRVYTRLQNHYTGEANDPHFKQFDIKGMKVVVDDSTVTQSQTNKYIDLLHEAYARLKAKGFANVWYGNVFIQCESCGGINPNNGGGVGGDYTWTKDTINIYVRPGPFVVELMIHELGHRFWFKGMNQSQRSKFETLVKVHAPGNSRIVQAPTIGLDNVTKLMKILYDAISPIWEAKIQLDDLRAQKVKPLVIHNEVVKQVQLAYKVGASGGIKGIREFFAKNDLLATVFTGSFRSTWSRLEKEAYAIDELVKTFLLRVEQDASPEDLDSDITPLSERASDFQDKLMNLLTEAVKQYDEKILDSADAARKQFQDDARPVTPVSTYGASNTDEAFAEVFMHFILGKDLTSDQRESFLQVLKKQASLT